MSNLILINDTLTWYNECKSVCVFLWVFLENFMFLVHFEEKNALW